MIRNTKMLIAVLKNKRTESFIAIFGTLSFRIIDMLVHLTLSTSSFKVKARSESSRSCVENVPSHLWIMLASGIQK